MNAESTRARSRRYSAVKARFFAADLIIMVVSLVIFQLFLSRPVSRFALGLYASFYANCFVYTCVFLLFVYIAGFPLHMAGSFFLERRFGLSDRSFGSWMTDEAKSVALSFALWMVCVEVFYLVLRNFPANWWMIAAFLWIFFTVVLARFLPVFLIPLFYKYLPIEDEPLKERIVSLADAAGIRLMDVCQIDLSRKTKKANAALVGLGKTRKVILADTLMKGFTPDEVGTVVAHELGHFKYRHIWQLLAFSGALTLAGFFLFSRVADRIAAITGANGISDLYLLPALVLIACVAGIAILPVQNLFSRILEKQADKFALRLTGNDTASFISVMKKLADMNLAEIDPSALKKIFLYSHPPIGERIRMAEEMQGAHDR